MKCPICSDEMGKRDKRTKTCGRPECGLTFRSLNYSRRKDELLEETEMVLPVRETKASYAKRAEQAKQAAPSGRGFNDPRNKKRIGRSPISVGVFDLETSHLKGDFARILCGVVRTFEPDEQNHVFRLDDYAPWKKGVRSDDSYLVADILKCLEDCDVVIAHNGLNFDMRMLRTRAIMNGLPPVNPIKIFDPCLLSRKVFNWSSNSLGVIAENLGVQEKKTPLEREVWVKAFMDGNRQCLDKIVEHCIADVDVLTEVAWKVRPYIKQLDSLGSYRGWK